MARIAYKSASEESVGTIPTVQPVPGNERQADCCNKEGWALKSTKKAYRFSDKQKAYLDVKFNIGQTSGRKVDGQVVTREMRRAQGLDGARLFLSPPQRLKGVFSGGVDPLSNVSAGTELQASAESAGASARYHTQDGRHPGETIFFPLLPGVACTSDGGQDFEVQRCLRFS